LVRNSIKATTVYLKKYNHFNEIETIIIKLLASLTQENNKTDNQNLLKESLKALKALRVKKFELRKFEYFDFDLWVESILTGDSIFNLSRRA